MLSPTRGMTPGPFRVGSAIYQCGLRCSGALVWRTCSARFDPQSDLHRRSKAAAPAPGLGAKAKRRGAHSKKRERRPLPGMLLFQDGSTHRWIAALGRDLDLVVTLDDAHKATLLEIADGWIRCAVLAERDKLKADTLS
jgi:hypothetical protein